MVNPLLSWVREELEPAEGIISYLGFKWRDDVKTRLEISRRRLLYPTYEIWANKRGIRKLGHIRFSGDLLEILKREKFKNIEKGRAQNLAFIRGVRVKAGVYDRDGMYGGPLAGDEEKVQDAEKGVGLISPHSSPTL
uniref:Uncharacterized protein n=1 Tax=Anthoceros angustus TaxID=48387 RepID=A0A2P1L4Y3_ANTAG|nr:hypothetical protein AnanMp60 [Anthoceros angustus]AVP12843.1 hypothetical protein AnanMp60 [Anthoceros angustus]